MSNLTNISLGLLASLLIGSGASAQGFLGQSYFAMDAGWERLENGLSDDGWGAGAEINMAMPPAHRSSLGMDLRFRGDYRDLLNTDIWNVNGLLLAYAVPKQGFAPYIGAGFGWVDFEVVDSTYLPVEVGVELGIGPIAVLPFLRYAWTFDSAVDNFWSAGAQAVYWVPAAGWGVTASFTYTEFDSIDGFAAADRNMGARIGLIFSYY